MNDVNKSLQVACHHCDLICEIPKLDEHQVALCPVCDGTMAQGAAKNPDNIIPITITALILFGLSLPFSFISFSKQGLVQSIHLLDAAAMMLLYNQPFLSALINITIIFLPISILVFILLLHGKAISLLPKKIQIFSTKALFQVKEWSMPEIFLVGVLVSLVKMISLAEVALGLSFWAYAGFVVCFVYTLVKLDKMTIWDKIDHHSQFSQSPIGVRAVDLNIAACPQCEILTSEHHCPRCATKVIVRDPHNLQKTVALIITSALLYIPANLYPIMTTVFLGSPEPATIIGGVALLWQHGSYPIALVIFVASVFVPLAKLTTLSILTWVVKKQAKHRQIPFTKIYEITEFLGKWSMVDVFVVAILVALVHLGGIVEIQPGPGALYFSAMVIVSMLAAHTFDPRQLWDIEQERMM